MIHPKEKADELIQNMFNFISVTEKNIKQALLSSKFCAIQTCNELINRLPNINNTPPMHRKTEDNYFQYWISVRKELENKNF